MKILVINAGSSSLKYQLFDMDTGDVLCRGGCENINVASSKGLVTHRKPGMDKYVFEADLPNHSVALSIVMKLLTDPTWGVVSDLSEIGAVGHRIVHGGEKLTVNVVGLAELDYLHEITPINPLHAPAAIAAIVACHELLPNVKHVVVADSAFYRTLPPESYNYALPYDIVEKHHIRRYGFHGTSHKYIAKKTAEYLGKPQSELRSITMHLGNGSSMSCVKDGKCFDTSMGLTPLEGLIMGTRCGSIDPAIVPFIMEKKGLTPEEMDTLMNKKSGLLGLCGFTDMRDVHKEIENGNKKAELALNMLVRSIKKTLGAYFFLLGGKVDALVFTAGIGENDDIVRAKVCEGLEELGVRLNLEENGTRKPGARTISTPDSKIKVLIIPTNEELQIAQATMEVLA